MGFSQKPQDQIEGLGSVLSLAESLKILLDGKALESTVKNFYALNDSEKAALESAKDTIAKADLVMAEDKKRKSILDAFHESLLADQKAQQQKSDSDNAALNDKEIANAAASLAIKNANIALDERAKEVDEKSKQADAALKDATSIKQQAEADRNSIEKDKIALAKKWEEVNSYEADLKSTAAQLQKLTGGL